MAELTRLHGEDSLNSPRSLKRTLGVPSIIFMVVAGAAPLTASTGVMPISFLFSENPAAPVYFVVATILLILFSVGFAAMSKHLPRAGAFYSYIGAGLGRSIGNGAAMLATGAYALTVIALTVYGGPFASQLVATFTGWQNSPWWLWSLVLWVLLAVLGYRNVDLSARVLSVLLVLEVIAILILGAIVLSKGGADGISAAPLNPVSAFSSGSPASGIMWAALVFVGFEATAIYRREAKNPDRTIPRATYGAVFLLGALYVFTAFFMVIGLGTKDAIRLIGENPSEVIFRLSDTFVSPVYTSVLNVLLLGSVFACAMSFQNVVNRYQLILGSAGMLPEFVGKVHGKHQAPSNASVVLSGAVLVAIIISAVLRLDPVMDVFTPLVGILGFAVITLLFLCSVSVIFFFRRFIGARPNIWVRFAAPFVASVGLLFVLMLAFANIETVAGSQVATVIVICLMIGLPLLGAFLGLRQRSSELTDLDSPEDPSDNSDMEPAIDSSAAIDDDPQSITSPKP